jgi:hypothetical protein
MAEQAPEWWWEAIPQQARKGRTLMFAFVSG